MSKIYVLCGLPASGKSTYVNRLLDVHPNAVVCSTDNYIEMVAAFKNQNYDEVFFEMIAEATTVMWNNFENAIAEDKVIIFDQTNLSRKKRRLILNRVPKHYEKIAIWIEIPDHKEWGHRLESRPGKNIPGHILVAMVQNATKPEIQEGFDEIKIVGEKIHNCFE